MNLLDLQVDHIAQTVIDARCGIIRRNYPPQDHWEGMVELWAIINGLKRTDDEFPLRTLVEGKARYNGVWDARDLGYGWPGRDHESYFKRDRRAAAILTEPYDGSQVVQLRALATKAGLVVHAPPNPLAGFWYPGSTMCLVLTRPDFGPVTWLPDQLAFKATE